MPTSKGRSAPAQGGKGAPLNRTALQEMVEWVETFSRASPNQKVFPIHITVVVDGQIILGEMISRSEFVTGTHKCVSDIIKQGIKTKDAATALSFSKQIDAYLEEPRRAVAALEKEPIEPGYIWLRKVRFSSAAAFDSSVPEPVTEIEMDRISAYWLGYAELPWA